MQFVLTVIKDKDKLEGLGRKLKMIVEEYYGRSTIEEMMRTQSPSSGGDSDLDESDDSPNGTTNNSSNIFNFFNQVNASETSKRDENIESNEVQRYLYSYLSACSYYITHHNSLFSGTPATSENKDSVTSPLDTINSFLPTVNLSSVFTPPAKEKKSKKDKKVIQFNLFTCTCTLTKSLRIRKIKMRVEIRAPRLTQLCRL